MLSLEFFSKGTKPNGKKITYEWARIFGTDVDYENEEECARNEFESIDYSIEDINVFKNYDIEQDWAEENLLSIMREIVKDNHPEAILISTINLFRKAIFFSNSSEMEPKMIITEDRTIVYYAMVGEDKCVLLIAWDKYYEDEED